MRKKVVQFITDLGDGGAETLVKDYALLLNKEKFDVVILTRYPIYNTANIKQLEKSNVKIITLNKSNSFFSKLFNKLTFKIRIPILMRRFIAQEKPDVIHAHLSQLKYLVCVSKELKGIKLFYTCHNVVEHYFGEKQIKEKIAAEELIKNNDMRLIALHNQMKQDLDALFHVNNTAVIHNGIDFNRFLNVSISKEEKRKELGIDKNAFVVGHVGRFAEQKNHTFLVEVFNEIAKKNQNAFLLMIGTGNTLSVKSKLEAYGLAERYMILSNRTDVPELMKAMDVFVFPSLFEGLGIVLIEAQLLQLRCVVSDRIPDEAIKSNSTVVMSLDQSPRKWRDVILDKSIIGGVRGDINEYDMNHEILKLEQLYLKN